MDTLLYAPFRQWHCCIRIWQEILLGRKVSQMQVHAGQWMLVVPCVGMDRPPSEQEILSFAMLINQWNEWGGVFGLRKQEVTGRRREVGRVCVRRVTDELCVLGNLFCLRDSDILLFESKPHMDLFVALVNCGFPADDVLFGPLCSVLEVVRIARCSEVTMARYEGETAFGKVRSPLFWLPLASIVWPGVETISYSQWQKERYQGDMCIETMIDSTIGYSSSSYVSILVRRDSLGRHEYCLFVVVRPSAWRAGCVGTILFMSYVGYEGRLMVQRSGVAERNRLVE